MTRKLLAHSRIFDFSAYLFSGCRCFFVQFLLLNYFFVSKMREMSTVNEQIKQCYDELSKENLEVLKVNRELQEQIKA